MQQAGLALLPVFTGFSAISGSGTTASGGVLAVVPGSGRFSAASKPLEKKWLGACRGCSLTDVEATLLITEMTGMTSFSGGATPTMVSGCWELPVSPTRSSAKPHSLVPLARGAVQNLALLLGH